MYNVKLQLMEDLAVILSTFNFLVITIQSMQKYKVYFFRSNLKCFYFSFRGPLDIPDPLNFTDPSGYEKCLTMCKKSIENLVTLLEEEEAAEAKKRPKIIKLPDPTIFTITSPSAWQKNKLRREIMSN